MKLSHPRIYLRYARIRLLCDKNGNLPQETTECLNCSTLFTGNYCSRCGQKRDTNRLTFRAVTHNFWGVLTNLEQGFFHTLATLFLCPGKMIREYIAGKRRDYLNPFQMLFIVATLYTFLHTVIYYRTTGINPFSVHIEINPEVLLQIRNSPLVKWATGSAWIKNMATLVIGWYTHNKAFSLLCGLPFYAIATKIVFRKKAPYNITEYTFLVAIFAACFSAYPYYFFRSHPLTRTRRSFFWNL